MERAMGEECRAYFSPWGLLTVFTLAVLQESVNWGDLRIAICDLQLNGGHFLPLISEGVSLFSASDGGAAMSSFLAMVSDGGFSVFSATSLALSRAASPRVLCRLLRQMK